MCVGHLQPSLNNIPTYLTNQCSDELYTYHPPFIWNCKLVVNKRIEAESLAQKPTNISLFIYPGDDLSLLQQNIWRTKQSSRSTSSQSIVFCMVMVLERRNGPRRLRNHDDDRWWWWCLLHRVFIVKTKNFLLPPLERCIWSPVSVCLSVFLCTWYLKKLLTGLKKITWNSRSWDWSGSESRIIFFTFWHCDIQSVDAALCTLFESECHC